MSLDNIKKKLKAIDMSMDLSQTNSPKIAIAELCSVIQSLIVEIEKIQKPNMTLTASIPRSPYLPEKRFTNPPLKRPNRTRPINAGDAK